MRVVFKGKNTTLAPALKVSSGGDPTGSRDSYAGCPVVSVSETPQLLPGQPFRRVKVVKTDGKYPLVAVEEMVVRTPAVEGGAVEPKAAPPVAGVNPETAEARGPPGPPLRPVAGAERVVSRRAMVADHVLVKQTRALFWYPNLL